ncbi:hypothetical protein [Nocardioides sp. CER19]|uniref:hypothetical protein n=1 Tax=Nocardioides sp. CER19 TaxID=3038538 RepID=UPI002447FFC1|nr:hypothetical protein [Nocardioides sp. CER19]MDH2415000.1 hypothetical protein [Nocardioides sp. CER19]
MTLVALVLIGAVATIGWRHFTDKVKTLLPDECVATVGALHASLDVDQAQNAGVIAAIGVRRGLPARAVTIALATAMQESKLHNLDYGDRDSVGLFQQRPSQGWGTRKQLKDPVYAIGRFYDALVRVDGYESMRITEAAQKVQRSGFPEAYADHEPAARALASSLTGQTGHAFSCRFGSVEAGRPAVVRDEVTGVFGELVSRPAVTGRTITVGVPSRAAGWALAHYLVAQGDRLGIRRVTYAGQAWSGDTEWAPVGARTAGRVKIDLAGPAG